MKNFIILFILGFTTLAFAQNKKIDTVSFQVDGVCEMCKERIENGALIRGVKYVNWDLVTKKLTVVYKTKKVSVEELHKAVAEVGHDTPLKKANDEVYDALPMCCLYRDGVEDH